MDAHESTLEVMIRLHTEGAESAAMLREELKLIQEELKKLQDQARETNLTLTDIAATSYASAAALTALQQSGIAVRNSQQQAGAATGNTNQGLWQQIQAIPVLGGLIVGLTGFLTALAVILGIVAATMILLGPVIVQTAGYIVLTTAYLVGLTAVLVSFTAGLAATVIAAGTAAAIFGVLSVAVVLLAEHLFQAGKIANDPLLGLEQSFGRMADTLGTKALPMAREIISFLTSLIPTIQSLGLEILNWFGPTLPSILEDAKAAVFELTRGFKELGQFLGPILTVVAGMHHEWDSLFKLLVQGGVSAVKWLVTELEKLSVWFDSNLPTLQPIVSRVFGLIGQTIDGLGANLDRLSQWFVQRMPAMGPIVGQVFSSMGTFIQNFGAAAGNLVDWFIANWPEIKKQADAVFKAFNDGWSLISPWLQVLWPYALQVVGTVTDELTKHSQGLHDLLALLAIVIALVLVLLGGLVVGVMAVLESVAHLYDWLKQLLTSYQTWNTLLQGAIDLLKILWALNPGSQLVSWVQGLIGDFQSLVGLIQRVWGFLGGGSQPTGPGSGAVGGAGGSVAGGPAISAFGSGAVGFAGNGIGGTQQVNIYLDGNLVGGFVQKVQAASLSRMMTLT